MSIYIFPLELIMKQREDKIKEIEQEHEKLLSINNKLKSLFNEEREKYDNAIVDLQNDLSNNIIINVLLSDSTIELHKNNMYNIFINIKNTTEELDFNEQILIQARRDFKIIENLKEKRKKEFQKNEDFKERKMLDEQANIRFIRREIESIKNKT